MAATDAEVLASRFDSARRMAAHIRDGSAGRWGSAAMPAFTALTAEQTGALADYVLKQ